MEQNTEPIPLNIQLTEPASLIGEIGLSVAGLAFAIFLTKDMVLVYDFTSSYTFEQWLSALKATLRYFMMTMTSIIVAIPERSPMSATLSLALNTRRMFSTNSLVRKIHACETMGAMTIICTDKTGTLTQNLMQMYGPDFYGLRDGREVGEDDLSKLIIEGISVNPTAFLEGTTPGEKPKGVGNPTEVVLLLWLDNQKRNYLEPREDAKVLDQLTFSTKRRFMAALVDSPPTGKKVPYVKGTPEIVLGKHQDVLLDNRRVDAMEYRSTMEAQLLKYQNMAMHTLGSVCKIVDDDTAKDNCVVLVVGNGPSFLDIVAISDPIRPGVPAVVARCQSAGIGIKIVTGDTLGTATEITRQIGLWKEEDAERNRITGAAFAELTGEGVLDRVLDLGVVSRARPTNKQRLVQLLQQRGTVVAVAGDGISDAPALNHTQIGLSMGTGTPVAKEASDITLLDDSFNSISTTMMWGRSLYKNTQRFIVFQLTISLVTLFIVLLGSLVDIELPLTVTQMLWMNLIMDTFAALVSVSIPPSESMMKEKPRKSIDFIITKSMRNYILGMGMAFLILLMGMLLWFNNERNGMTPQRLTIFFTSFVMLQLWNPFNARVSGTSGSVFKGISGPYGMRLVVFTILGNQFIIVQFNGAVFRTEPLNFTIRMIAIASTSLVLWVGEGIRPVRRFT